MGTLQAKKLFSQKGFTLIETLLSMGLMAISLASVIAFSSQLGQHQRTERQKAAVYDFKEELIVTLNNSKYWQNIIVKAGKPHPRLNQNMNSELACVRDGTMCNEGDYDLTIFDMQDQIRFDAQDPTAGFNSRGEICHSFSTENTAAGACDFRFRLKWSPICERGSTSCVNPLIRIQVDLEHNPRMNFQMNATDLNFNYTIVADPISDPTINNLFLYTNSTVENWGTTALDVDLADAVNFTGPISSLGFSAPAISAFGGTVTIAGASLHYEPAPGFYGKDVISLSVTAPSGNVLSGLITIGVMTPYTWLGPKTGNGIGETKDAENFCGQVVSGACDRLQYPPNDLHFVFNDLCISCEVIFNSNSTTFEMAATYTSTVWLGEFAPNVGWRRGSTWAKYPVFEQKNGRFAPHPSVAEPAMTISAFLGANWTYSPNTKAFVLSGGEFIAPRSTWWWTRVIGSVDIAPGVFKHNQGKFEVFSIESNLPGGPADLNVFRVDPSTEFWNLSFGTISWNLGDNAGINIANSFRVKNRLGVYPQFYTWNNLIDKDALCTWENNAVGVGTYSDDIIIYVEGDIETKKRGGRGTAVGCKAPQIRFVGAGVHRIVGNADRPFDPDPVATEAWIRTSVPHLPFLKIVDPAVSVRIEGSVGFRRGLINESNSTIDFSNAAIVLGNTDPGTVTFQPEAVAGGNKNPLRDLYLASSGGGQLVLGSRRIHVSGGLYSLFNNETVFKGTGPVGTVSEIHAWGDIVLGPGEHFKNQSANTEPVRIVINGANAQTLHGGAQAATFTRTSYDGQSQMDIYVNKPAGAGTLRFQGLLTALRDYVYIQGPINYVAGSALYIPDSGNNSFVHNIGMGPYVSNTNAFMKTVSINHNIRVVSDLFFTNFNWNDLNYGTTKTVEATAAGLRLRVAENFIISTMNQSGAFDTPLRSVGTNTFEIMPIRGYGGPQGVFRPLFEIRTPNSEVVALPEISLFFSGWTTDGYVRAIDYKGHLSVKRITLDGQTWVCMYPSSNGNQSTLSAPRTNLTGYIKASAIMTNGQTLSPGITTLTNGSIIADSDPTYPCP